jgi:two-component system NarL family sensor kinase
VLLSPCASLFAQRVPDSLVKKLSTASNDSARTRILLDMGEAIEETSTRESLGYYNQAFTFAKKTGNGHLILSSLNDIGVAYIELNKFDSAILSFEGAIEVARGMHDTLRVARIMANIGNVHLHQKDRAGAIDYYLKSVRIWETCSDQTMLPRLYANICSLFTDQQEYDKAVEYGHHAFELAQKNGDENSAVNALLNLSGAYGEIHQSQKQFASLNQALPLAKKGGDLEQIATVYHNLGDYYFSQKEYKHSLDHFLESFAYVKQMGNEYHLCTSYAALAEVYLKLGQDVDAKNYIVLAEELASRVGSRVDLGKIYETRAEVEDRAGNYKLANQYLSKRMVLSDSIFKAETSEKVADVEARFQNEKKQKEIASLQKDRQLQVLSIRQKSVFNNFLITLVIALLLLGFFGFRNYRHRQQLAKQTDLLQQQQIRELEKDKQLVAVGSMLKGQQDERARLAKDLHDGLGGLLSGVKYTLSNMKDNLIITPDNRAVFERSLDMLDTSIRELRRVAHNMMPEMLVKYGLDETLKEYCNSINETQLLSVKYQAFGMEGRLDSSMEIIIYRIIQELVNNTLKHAAATEVLVQLIKEQDRLSIIVEDNGKGFDTAILDSSKAAGFASIASRVDYLKGRLEVQSTPGKGTMVNIELNT